MVRGVEHFQSYGEPLVQVASEVDRPGCAAGDLSFDFVTAPDLHLISPDPGSRLEKILQRTLTVQPRCHLETEIPRHLHEILRYLLPMFLSRLVILPIMSYA